MCVEIDPVLRSMYAHIWVCWSVTPLGLVHSRLYSFGSIFELVELHEKWKQTIERKMQHTKTGCWIRLGKKKYFFFPYSFLIPAKLKKRKRPWGDWNSSGRFLFVCYHFSVSLSELTNILKGERKKKKYATWAEHLRDKERKRARAHTHTQGPPKNDAHCASRWH